MNARSKPDTFEPPYAAYHVHRKNQPHFATSVFGIQTTQEADGSPLLYELLALLSANVDGRPQHIEHAWHIDPDGYRNSVVMAYWNDGGAMQRFMARADFATWRATPRDGPIGWWRESMYGDTSSADISFGFKPRYGVARHSDVELVQHHGYMGSMRDRVPDYLSGKADAKPGQLEQRAPEETFGRHLVIADLPDNICYIRGPFGSRHAPPDQQQAFKEIIVPVLTDGADYLTNNPLESNCISMRLVEEVNLGFDNDVEFEIIGWFLTLQDLERWTANHPLHLAILRNAVEFHRKFDFKSVVNQGHEVLIAPADQIECEYSNCHPNTGFLPYFGTRPF